MKRFQLILLIVVISISTAFSQESHKLANHFNRWSVDGSLGFTKTYSSFSSGFRNNTTKLLTTELSVRYMFNEYLGVKADLGFHSLKNAYRSLDFQSDQYRYSLQGVINAGRLFRIEDWTKKINVLVHSGIGVGSLYNYAPDVHNNVDDVMTFIIGGTLQVKTSSRTALNFDASMTTNIFQNHEFAGGEPNKLNLGVLLSGSIGFSIYIGKNKTHADWYIRDDNAFIRSQIRSLDKRLTEQENLTTSIDNKMQTQLNNLQFELDSLPENELRKENYSQEDLVLRALIKYSYFDIFFGFDETEVDNASLSSINLLVNYLKANLELTVTLIGFADELGTSTFNQELSQKRALKVEELLINAGILKDRIVVEGKGEHSSIEGGSSIARRFARRVSVRVLE